MSFKVPETHFCHGCKSNTEGKCMHPKSNFRRMLLIRKTVRNCRYRRLHDVINVPGTVPKVTQDPSLTKILDEEDEKKESMDEDESIDVNEPWPKDDGSSGTQEDTGIEYKIPPQEPDLTKIVEIAEDATKESADSKPKAIEKEDEEPGDKDSGVNVLTSMDPHTGTAHNVHPDDVTSTPIVLKVAPELVGKEPDPDITPGDPVIDPGDIKFIDDVEEEDEEIKEDPKEGESLTAKAIIESEIDTVKERADYGEKIAKSMLAIDPAKGKNSEPITLIENQPLVHVESKEDGSVAAGPTPPIDEPEEEETAKGPTGITLHPKGEPDDGDNGPTVEKGKLFLEEVVNDIENKSELPKNGLLELELEDQSELASNNCVDTLENLDRINGMADKGTPLHIDPDTIFEGLEGPPLEKGTEIGILSGTNLDGAELMFCFNCQQEHPIGYFSPEGNICLNCVQVELRRVLFEIRQKFFDPSAADHELLDEVLKDIPKDGKRLSMLDTLYIARDLLQSYSPLARKERQSKPTKEEMPAMSSPFLITCEEMEPRVLNLTWAQLQKIARKMDVPLNQPIDWIAAQVCARIKRCDKCDQLTLSKA